MNQLRDQIGEVVRGVFYGDRSIKHATGDIMTLLESPTITDEGIENKAREISGWEIVEFEDNDDAAYACGEYNGFIQGATFVRQSFREVKWENKIITLCGSTKFKDKFIEAQKMLTLEGHIVISVGMFGHSGDNEVWKDGVKEMLDRMHLAKIDMADSIFVINVNGYIGESTTNEIKYAISKDKNILYLESPVGVTFCNK